MLFLSIDVGTSAVKLCVVDHDRRVLAAGTAAYPYILLPGEKVEIDPEVLFASIYRAATLLPEDLRRAIDIVCYDTFSPSPVFLREDGGFAYPNVITHLDRRSRDQSRRVDDVVGKDRYLEVAGIYPFTGGAGLMTVLWMQEHEPGCLDETARIGHLSTFVHHRLTGRWTVDLVNASMLGVYETTTQAGWSVELLDAFALRPEWFGEIHDPGTLLGTLTAAEAGRLGVPAGVPVAVGTNDMASAQVGAGNTTSGSIMNTAGSSDMVSILTDVPAPDPRYYLRNAALPGLWQIYATTAGGFALDWFHREFCREMSIQTFYEEYLPECLARYPEVEEVAFDPYLTGDRQSLERRTGAWRGLTLAATREEMLVTVLRAMNRVLYEVIRGAASLVEVDRVIKLTGGLSGPAFVRLKEAEMPGFTFEVVDDCPVLGNVALAQRHLDG